MNEREAGDLNAPRRRAEAVLQRCREYSFSAAGICAAEPSEHAAAYLDWIARGCHGQMTYMARDVEARLDPAVLLPGVRSVIAVADRYANGAREARVPGRGRIARYARGEDYHVVLRARLEALAAELRETYAGERFRVCVDTVPVMEREHAARAGIGRIGKHTLLIGREGRGSWLVLGVILTTLELAPLSEDGAPPPPPEDPCGSCDCCIRACPTEAITPWRVDASRCISYLTIEHHGEVPPALGAQVQDWIFGCDVCQEVCPHNQPTRRARGVPVHPAYAPYAASFDLLAVLGWTPTDWEAARLHGALRRASHLMWVRNAALAAGGALQAQPSVAGGLPASTAAVLVRQLERLAEGQGASDPAALKEEVQGVRAAARLALAMAAGKRPS